MDELYSIISIDKFIDNNTKRLIDKKFGKITYSDFIDFEMTTFIWAYSKSFVGLFYFNCKTKEFMYNNKYYSEKEFVRVLNLLTFS